MQYSQEPFILKEFPYNTTLKATKVLSNNDDNPAFCCLFHFLLFIVQNSVCKIYEQLQIFCGDRNAKTTLNHRLLFSLLLVVGGLGLAHAGYNVGVGRADITGPAAEVSPEQLMRHCCSMTNVLYTERQRSALLSDFPPKQFRPSLLANGVLFGPTIASCMRR